MGLELVCFDNNIVMKLQTNMILLYCMQVQMMINVGQIVQLYFMKGAVLSNQADGKLCYKPPFPHYGNCMCFQIQMLRISKFRLEMMLLNNRGTCKDSVLV